MENLFYLVFSSLSSLSFKALVSVSDVEIAEEIVKVHTFIPAKLNNSDLKITQVKQRVGLNTPVQLPIT